MDYDDYHFKIKISVLGDKGVGKSTITNDIINGIGKIVEAEESDELNIKVIEIV